MQPRLGRPDLLPDRVLGDAQPPRDLSITHAVQREPRDEVPPFARKAPAAGPPTGPGGEPRHAAVRVAPLMSSHGPVGAAEGDRDFLLRGVAAVDQHDHRVRFGHRIRHAVVVHGESGDDHDPVLALRAHHAARIDADGPRRDRRGQGQVLPRDHGPIYYHAPVDREQDADRIGCAAEPHNRREYRGKRRSGRKWRTGIGAHRWKARCSSVRGLRPLGQEVWSHASR